MALEKSVLDSGSIAELLKKHYDLDIIAVRKIDVGSANCYCVSDGHALYFLKEFQSYYTGADLYREAELVDYLTDCGFPAVSIIPTVNLERCFTYMERCIYLQPYMEGGSYVGEAVPNSVLIEAAGLLGRMHSILSDYSLPEEMGISWLVDFSAEEGCNRYDKLLELAENVRDIPQYEHIKRDLIFKRRLVSEIVDYRRYYENATYCATHGDFTIQQCICKKGHIDAIIDFSSARRLPVDWEIMRSYIQSSGACQGGGRINVQELCEYVTEYMKFAPLTKADLQAMPYIYLYQLARSRYGFKEFLTNRAENKTELLEFGFWRTDICRVLYEQKEELSKKLVECI